MVYNSPFYSTQCCDLQHFSIKQNITVYSKDFYPRKQTISTPAVSTHSAPSCNQQIPINFSLSALAYPRHYIKQNHIHKDSFGIGFSLLLCSISSSVLYEEFVLMDRRVQCSGQGTCSHNNKQVWCDPQHPIQNSNLNFTRLYSHEQNEIKVRIPYSFPSTI